MITHKQYLDDTKLHKDYYREIIRDSGMKPRFSPVLVSICKAEFEAGNVHFNKYPAKTLGGKSEMDLARWDARATAFRTHPIQEQMKKRGDYLTQAGLVRLCKTAMSMTIEGEWA